MRKLVEQDGVFAIVGGLGDPTHLAVMDYLAEKGVPDLFLGGGVVRFTEPIVKTRFAMTTDYETEAKIMADYVKEHFAGKTEGILYQNDDAGKTGLDKLTERTEGQRHQDRLQAGVRLRPVRPHGADAATEGR